MKKSVSLSSTERVLTDITEFLKYPILSATPKSRANKSNGLCILTSSDTIEMMEKQKEEQEAKELSKKEREEKKQQREQEKIRKAEEKLKREAEQKRKAEERKLEKKQKAE